MKARRNSRVACGHHVRVGSKIIHRGGKWMCLPCALEAIRAARFDIPVLDREDARHPKVV
jgi:hypothetical protein